MNDLSALEEMIEELNNGSSERESNTHNNVKEHKPSYLSLIDNSRFPDDFLPLIMLSFALFLILGCKIIKLFDVPGNTPHLKSLFLFLCFYLSFYQMLT
ncbi:uncharacterized protein PMUG01_02011700 [Plasmodium malariae]|uniref:Uncharacterized protein n=1 Tax=Plasmodium malariae TaxID=5858 RepID=A0A1A8WYJ0_PLAMA|nr:uncharacterized protein PMUG01_02011700 [Plasmodium malariae]SBS98032.1 hypothetical protein PMALA_062140 [Plasmodium malariae]SBT87072.1 hypothetical protein PMUG01_02011700 [Plasmodium malariae]